jgi:hypothetical protein
LQPLLIENIEEELDPVLDPVLERRLVKKGKSWVLQLADKEVRATQHLCKLADSGQGCTQAGAATQT